jgi:hypothetical protein
MPPRRYVSLSFNILPDTTMDPKLVGLDRIRDAGSPLPPIVEITKNRWRSQDGDDLRSFVIRSKTSTAGSSTRFWRRLRLVSRDSHASLPSTSSRSTAAPWLRTSPLQRTIALSRETPIDLAQAQDQHGRRVGAGRGSNKHDARFCLRRT